MIHRLSLLALLVCSFTSSASAKYALLVGVSKYEHPRLNETQLKYPEADSKAIGDVLKASGYQVQILLGKQATRQAIRTAMKELATKASGDDVLILGFFGHGVQYGESAFYCPYDTDLRVVADADGKALRDSAGVLRQEPDPAKMVAMRDMLDAMTVSKAGGKLLMADCCREDPSRARGGLRGRAFGEGLQVSQLPVNCSALFACSAGEQAFEHDEWEHGAFTKALLDVLQTQTEITANELSAMLYRRVNQLVAAKASANSKQTVSNVTRDLVDLKLDPNRKLVDPAPKTLTPDTYINSVGGTMKLIPAGTFMMGSKLSAKEVNERYPGGEESFYEDEHPRHSVTISRSFYMGIHEVTVGQFRKFVDAVGYETEAEKKDSEGGYGLDASTGSYKQSPEYSWRNPGFSQQDTEPVVNVSWHDAVAYCNWLSQQEGKAYRLPTEAEWEYACRAGSDSEFAFGDASEELTKYGNVADAKAKAKYSGWTTVGSSDGYVTTSPVGSFAPNRLGLYDMHGYVWEWCNDGKREYKSGAATDPEGPTNEEFRVLRGGSWGDSAWSCRSAYRYGGTPSFRDDRLGFRLVSVSQ